MSAALIETHSESFNAGGKNENFSAYRRDSRIWLVRRGRVGANWRDRNPDFSALRHIHRGRSHGNVWFGAWLHGAWIYGWGEAGRRNKPNGNDFEDRSIRYVIDRN